MKQQELREKSERERLLGRAMRPLADDLRLLEFGHYLPPPGRDTSCNVESLVRSSIELTYEPGALSFVCVSGPDLVWGRRPQLTLHLELHCMRVHAYFRLILSDQIAAIEIDYLAFDDPSTLDSTNTANFVSALESAARTRPEQPSPSAANGRPSRQSRPTVSEPGAGSCRGRPRGARSSD